MAQAVRTKLKEVATRAAVLKSTLHKLFEENRTFLTVSCAVLSTAAAFAGYVQVGSNQVFCVLRFWFLSYLAKVRHQDKLETELRDLNMNIGQGRANSIWQVGGSLFG